MTDVRINARNALNKGASVRWFPGLVWELSGLTGRHSSDPQHRRCGVGHYTDTQERVWLPLLSLKQSVYRAEFLAVARALEECHPHEVVSDCQGVVKALQASQTGGRHPKERAIAWRVDVDSGRMTADDFQGNQQADVPANQGMAQHGPLEPDPTWLTWADFANKVYHFWLQVGPQLRDRPEAEPRA
eukprot:1197160-Amphidinium_carterae.1